MLMIPRDIMKRIEERMRERGAKWGRLFDEDGRQRLLNETEESDSPRAP